MQTRPRCPDPAGGRGGADLGAACRLPAKAVVMLYRQEVLGESLEELAAEVGISVDALRKRRDRAVASFRRLLNAA